MKTGRSEEHRPSSGLQGPARQLRILLADDQTLFTDALAEAIEGSGIVVVPVPSFDALLAKLATEDHGFDLVIIDLSLRADQALDCLRIVRERFPDTNVALLTGAVPPEFVREAIGQHGAIGVIPRSSTLASLGVALRFMAEGEPFIPASLLDPPAGPVSEEVELSSEETEILRRIAEGLSNREIGAANGLPEKTVKSRLKTICRKLKVHNRTKAALAAREKGFI